MSSGNPAPTGLRDLGARLSTAIVIGIAFIAAILWGGRIGIGLVVGLVAVFATGEFYAILRRERRLPNESLGMIAVGVMPFAASVWGVPGLTTTLGALMIASLVWHITFSEVRASDTSVTVFGALYVGFTLAHIVLIRELPDGRVLALATVASVWANDTIAYLVGSSLGRHKLAPAISPRKTWEGLVAGTIATTTVWCALSALPSASFDVVRLASIGLVASLAAVIGDLAESRLKRETALKDSGDTLPGHGGFLDRFDSMILVAITTYYAILMIGVR